MSKACSTLFPVPFSLLYSHLGGCLLQSRTTHSRRLTGGGKARSVLGDVGAEWEMAHDLSSLRVEGRIPNAWLPGLWQCPEEQLGREGLGGWALAWWGWGESSCYQDPIF